MPEVTFESSNKLTTGSDFPKLKLEKQERARIVLLTTPKFEYVHDLKMPEILNGVPQMEKKERARGGGEYETYKTVFLNRVICLGDEGILKERGTDPNNCPICAMAAAGDMTKGPYRRFAMPVIRYGIQPNSFNPTNPYTCSTVVWAFTDKVFGKLVDYQEEWKDLKQHDLMLGPCTNAVFQQYEIAISNTAIWLSNEQVRDFTWATFQNNQPQDLAYFIGKKSELSWIKEDLEKITDRWKAVNAYNNQAAGVAVNYDPSAAGAAGLVGAPSLSEGLDNLITSTTGMDSPGESVDFSQLLASAPAAAAPTPPPAAAPAVQVPEQAGIVQDQWASSAPPPQPEQLQTSVVPAAAPTPQTSIPVQGNQVDIAALLASQTPAPTPSSEIPTLPPQMQPNVPAAPAAQPPAVQATAAQPPAVQPMANPGPPVSTDLPDDLGKPGSSGEVIDFSALLGN